MSALEISSTGVDSYEIGLWRRQLTAVTRAEIAKSLFSRGAVVAYVLAAIPIILTFTIGVVGDHVESVAGSIDHARRIYAIVYSGFILGAVVFLGSAAIFTSLFRGEVLNGSIHYYLLSPVRREILVTGKFIAGLVTGISLFGVTTCLSYLFIYIPFGLDQLMRDVVSGLVPTQLTAYLGITILGCIGYGSLFLMSGLLFRNPLFPVVVVAGWEMIHFLLPPAFKIFSVVYYLKGLIPIPMDEGPLAVVVAPPPLWVSILGILVLAVVSISVATVILKRIEVRYTDD